MRVPKPTIPPFDATFKPDPVSKADVEWIVTNANRAASNATFSHGSSM